MDNSKQKEYDAKQVAHETKLKKVKKHGEVGDVIGGWVDSMVRGHYHRQNNFEATKVKNIYEALQKAQKSPLDYSQVKGDEKQAFRSQWQAAESEAMINDEIDIANSRMKLAATTVGALIGAFIIGAAVGAACVFIFNPVGLMMLGVMLGAMGAGGLVAGVTGFAIGSCLKYQGEKEYTELEAARAVTADLIKKHPKAQVAEVDAALSAQSTTSVGKVGSEKATIVKSEIDLNIKTQHTGPSLS